MSVHPDPAGFWRSFRAKSEECRSLILGGHLRAAFADVEKLLSASGFGFAFELTRQDDEAILILTPESQPALAKGIDALLAERPPIPGWRFHGRRVRKPLTDAVAFVRNIYGIDVTAVQSTVHESGDGRYDVFMYLRLPSNYGPTEASGLVQTFLEHALGEETVMSRVRGVRVEATPPAGASVLAAKDLVDFLIA